MTISRVNILIGLYPLLQDETCWFLAVDFDKKNWQKDVQAFIDTCKELNVPASIERSDQEMGVMFGSFSIK